MKQMWSPWRSQYIESFHTEKKEKICIFCSAPEVSPDNDKSLIVRKGIHTFTVMNLYPYNNGHLMVVPYRHLSSFEALNAEEKLEVMDELDLAIKALKIISHPDGFNIGANLGQVGGAGIDDHIHFHIVPRWSGDTNFMPVLGEVKVISQDLIKTKKELIKAYDQLLKK